MKPLFEKPSVPEGQSWAFLNRRLDDEIPFQWHYHREYELTLTLNSRGQRFVGDHFGQYDDGDLVLLGPNLPHTWASAAKVDDTAPHVALVMWFRPEWIDGITDHAAELARIPPLLQASRRGIRFSPEAAAAVRAMVEAMEELPPARRLFNLLDILVRVAGDREMAPLASPAFQQSAFEASARPRIERVLDHIHAHYKERLTIDALAELCHLSASGLQRMFKRHTRMTIFEYMAQLRIGQACQILMATGQPVARIAEAVGYDNLSHFNRQFRSLKHVTPREFRRNFDAAARRSGGRRQPAAQGVSGRWLR